MMGDDVTMVDTSVFGALNRQNSSPLIVNDLQDLIARGDKIVVCASTYQEILNTPDPELRAAQLRQIRVFKMTVQPPTSIADRLLLYDINANLKEQARAVELKDLAVISDVQIYMRNAPGIKVKFFSVERMVRNWKTIKANYNIEISDKSRVLANLGPRVAYVVPKSSWNRALKRGAAVVIVSGIAALAWWLQNKFNKSQAEEQQKRIENEIRAEIAKKTATIKWLQLNGNKGDKVFANVDMEMLTGVASDGQISLPRPTLLFLKKVDISNREINTNPTTSSAWGFKMELAAAASGNSLDKTTYTFSFEVEAFSEDDLEIFRDLADEYLATKRQSQLDARNQELQERLRTIREEVVTSFGDDVWFLKS
jgi:predicted nucleic acid-binding protein